MKNIAKELNPQVTEYVKANPGRTAIVMMDFCCGSSAGGDALVNTVVNQNVRYVQGCNQYSEISGIQYVV